MLPLRDASRRFAWDATHLENPICQVELQILLDTKCRFRIVCSDHSLVVVVYSNAIGFPTWLSIALPYGPRLLPTRAKHVETRRVKFFADDVRDSSIYPTSSIKIKTCCHSYLAECFGIKSCLVVWKVLKQVSIFGHVSHVSPWWNHGGLSLDPFLPILWCLG